MLSDTDSDTKIGFTSEGEMKIYIDNILDDTYYYSLNTSCNSQQNNSYDVFLKQTLSLSDSRCHIINNIGPYGILSLTTERGQLDTYKKQ